MDNAEKIKIGLALVAAVVAVYLVKKPGAAADLGEEIGGAIIDAAGGVATGVIDGISEGVGIPTTKQTITDAAECKLYMNRYGVLEASFACSAPAFAQAIEPVKVVTDTVKETAGSWWDWLTTPSASDYQPVKNTGAFDRQ